jgi:hypothetical protein
MDEEAGLVGRETKHEFFLYGAGGGFASWAAVAVSSGTFTAVLRVTNAKHARARAYFNCNQNINHYLSLLAATMVKKEAVPYWTRRRWQVDVEYYPYHGMWSFRYDQAKPLMSRTIDETPVAGEGRMAPFDGPHCHRPTEDKVTSFAIIFSHEAVQKKHIDEGPVCGCGAPGFMNGDTDMHPVVSNARYQGASSGGSGSESKSGRDWGTSGRVTGQRLTTWEGSAGR